MHRPLRQSKHSAANMRVLDAFFNDIEENVQDIAADVAKDVLDTLFHYSPHYGDSAGDQAMGEYDANHKISVDGKPASGHINPTFSKARSKSYNKTEQKKVDRYKEKAKNYRIENNTDHAISVETGLGWNKTPAYRTYQKTLQYIKQEYKNVLK